MSASPVSSNCESPAQTANPNDKVSSITPASPETEMDTGPLDPEWCQDLLKRYNSDLSTLDDQEHEILQRIVAIQKLQLIWSAAGRISEKERSDQRIKIRTTKVSLEDQQVSKKRQKLSGVITALENVVGMLDEASPTGDRLNGHS